MEKGDFYASTGVRLAEVRRQGRQLSARIAPEQDITYTTRFIDTRTNPKKKGVGITLAQVKGVAASYTQRGDELYVRAKVISSKPLPTPSRRGMSKSPGPSR